MNVFILNAGRCGSTTFINACQHISNFTSSHESRASLLGKDRLDYPENHIEADNRLNWFLGKLDQKYGDDAICVHLKRNNCDVAKSYVNRYDFESGIIKAYRNNIIMGLPEETSPMHVSLDYCDTVNSNIELFLKDKTHSMVFHLESAKKDFHKFWCFINAKGDIDAALSEFDVLYNTSVATQIQKKKTSFFRRVLYKIYLVPKQV